MIAGQLLKGTKALEFSAHPFMEGLISLLATDEGASLPTMLATASQDGVLQPFLKSRSRHRSHHLQPHGPH